MGASKSKPERRIVLVGKTGDGKSSAGNTILRKPIFTVKASPNSETAKSKVGYEIVNRRKITVTDTPGIFDTNLDEEKIKSELISSIVECAPAVDAVIIVRKVERYTQQEKEILDKISEYCGEDTFKHAVILFTHGEQLEGQTIEEFVKLSPKLQNLVDKCGGRCHAIDNKYWRKYRLRRQVRNMMETIDKMVKENGCYTNELLQIVEEEIQEEMINIDDENLLLEERRRRAKNEVFKKLCIRLAGVATGILIGALLGIGVAVGSVVAILKAAKLKKVCKAIATTVTAVSTLVDKVVVAAAAAATGGAAAVGTGAVSAAAAAAGAGSATAGATAVAGATAGAVAVEAGIVTGAAGATAAAGAVAVEAGVAAGSGIGAAAGSGIAAGVILGVAAFAGAVGGGITGYKAAEEADSVLDAIKMSAKANFENAKEVVRRAEQLPSNIYEKL